MMIIVDVKIAVVFSISSKMLTPLHKPNDEDDDDENDVYSQMK